MLTTSVTLHRKAKDGQKGNDGIGVKNADVMFAVSTDRYDASKIADSSWKTNFSDITLKKGSYVWTCTKITYTSGSPVYTGKYCLGACEDFASVEEVYVLSADNKNEPDDTAGWAKTYKAEKGKYLWTCTKVKYNNSDSYQYLNKKCVMYFPTDGTSFTAEGMAKAHYEKSSLIPSGYKAGEVYLVDINDTSFPNVNAPCVIKVINVGTSALAFSSRKSETGDGYRIDKNLWVNKGEKWVDFGEIQGTKGEDGEDALEVYISPNPIIFKANESGNVDGSQKVELCVSRGNEYLRYPDDYSVSIKAVENFDLGSGNKNFVFNEEASTKPTFDVYASGVKKNTYVYGTVDEEQKVLYPASSATVEITVTLNDNSSLPVSRIVNIQVDFTKHYGGLYTDVNGLQSKFGKLEGENGTLKQMESAIKQNSDNISLMVEKTEYEGYKGTVSSQFSQIQQQYNSINMTVSSVQKGLEDTGIYISERKIKFVADNFGVYNNNGVQTMSVDADGNLVTEGSAKIKGSIEATAGKFGSLNITSKTDKTGFSYYSVNAYTPGTSVISPSQLYIDYQGVSLSKGYIVFGDSPIQATVELGGHEYHDANGQFYWDDGFVYVDTESLSSANHDVCAYGAFALQQNSQYSAIGYKAHAEGGKNNYAFYADEGDFKADNGSFIGGRCDKILTVTDNTVNNTLIGDNVSAIICKNTSGSVTLKLPKNPKVGMTFKVYQGGKTVYFYGNGHTIFSRGHNYPDKGIETWDTSTQNQMSIFMFDGDNWFVGFMNG